MKRLTILFSAAALILTACHSYNKTVSYDDAHFEALQAAKQANYQLIYRSEKSQPDPAVKPMMEQIYETMLDDLVHNRKDSPIFTHHINYVLPSRRERRVPYEKTEPNQLVVDYIASMTDDYFVDLYKYLFPHSATKIQYIGYFDGDRPYRKIREDNP